MLFLCQKSHGIQVRGFSHTEVKLLWFCDFALSKTMSKFLIAKLFSAVFLGIDQIILIWLEKLSQLVLLQQVLISLWDKWPKCL